MANATEELLKQLKRSKKSEGLIVPLIETFLERPVEVEDKLDRQFLASLIKARSAPRQAGIYSPSMLAACIRQVYFSKTGVKKAKLGRVESHAIFLDGNFRHFKWQFVLWKMHRAGIVKLIDAGTTCLGTEIFVSNEKGDFGGTIDTLVYLPKSDLVCTLDYKGMNGNSFLGAVGKGQPSMTYILQSVGYGGLANSFLANRLPKKIESVFIIGENKNGAVRTRAVNSPLGLQEWKFDLEDYRPLVSKRLKVLRSYERRGKVPPPECVSTRSRMFKDCAFSVICRGEVEQIEKQKKIKAVKINKNGKPKVNFGRKSR